MNDQATELQDETAIVETTEGIDPLEVTLDDENTDFDIVLAGQEQPQGKPEVKNTSDHILNRVMKKRDKLQGENVSLQDENVSLRQQLEQVAKQPQVNAVGQPPDEYNYDDRGEYLQAKSLYDQQMLSNVVSSQLNQQQNGHRIAAREQEQEAKLRTYAENASKLKVRDFNQAQDKAFDVLGDDFAQLIARELPEDAPKLIYYLGKNSQVAADMRDEYISNPGSVTFKLGKLAGNLTIKPRESQAADPESKIESGAVGGINENWQAQLDKIGDETDMNNISKSLNAIRAVKAKAKAAGYDISTLK